MEVKEGEAVKMVLFPLFGSQRDVSRMTEEEAARWRREQVLLVQRGRNDAAVQAIYNLIERTAARLQAEALQADAGKHERGVGCGAAYVCGTVRAWLEGEVLDEGPDEEK